MTTSPVQSTPNGNQLVVPMSLGADWVEIISAGGMDDQDQSGTIVDFDAVVAAANRIILDTGGLGTHVLFMLAYVGAASQSPVIVPGGRHGDSGLWQKLCNADGDYEITLTVDTTNDLNMDSVRYTTPSLTTQLVDLCGNTQLACGVATVIAGGTPASAKLLAKII